jgi:ABC-type dipeptide/oligopeptide/nickel transport system ATPase subunit
MPPILKVDNLTKKYRKFTAVDHISFEVKEGEVVGLLGPNGAGKSCSVGPDQANKFGLFYVEGDAIQDCLRFQLQTEFLDSQQFLPPLGFPLG